MKQWHGISVLDDIAKALSKSDQFDFLIDIVPRENAVCGANGAGLSKRVCLFLALMMAF
jgi:hypothetical protein